METALFDNRIVTVEGFLRAQSSPSDYPTCPVCNERLFLSATRSVKKAASFNHAPRDEDANRCQLSYSYHPSYSWLDDVDLEAIESRAESLRTSFYQLDSLKRTFTFLSRMAGKGAISQDVFALLLKRAEKFNIWRYAGLPLWAVPYVLLTLTDFYVRREGKKTYVVRFIIEKPSRSKLNTTWLHPGQCNLVKYFVNKGKATKVFGVQPSYSGEAPTAAGLGKVKNPMPFSEADFNALAADTAWIRGGLENFLRGMTIAPTPGLVGSVGAAFTSPVHGEMPVEETRPHKHITTAVVTTEVSISHRGGKTRVHTSAIPSHGDTQAGVERITLTKKSASEARLAGSQQAVSDYSRGSEEADKLSPSRMLVSRLTSTELAPASSNLAGVETGTGPGDSSWIPQINPNLAGSQTHVAAKSGTTQSPYDTRAVELEAVAANPGLTDTSSGLSSSSATSGRGAKLSVSALSLTNPPKSRGSGFWAWVKLLISG